VITRSIFARFLFAFGILLSLLLLASAELSTQESGPPPGMRREVWQVVVAELRRDGWSERQLPQIEDLELPGVLPALAGRSLRVASACWDEGPRRTQFRLECGEPAQCLPFLVYVHNHDHDDQNSIAREGAGSCRPLSHSHHALEPAPKPLVRAGDRATALFLSDRLRMTTRVTCLERGREGEVIRVRSQDGRVFRARISGPARLEALPQ
jgi:hypothetical protein